MENETVSAMASLSMHQRSCYSMESSSEPGGNVSPASSTNNSRHRHLSSSSKRHSSSDGGQIGEDDISEETGTPNEEPMDHS